MSSCDSKREQTILKLITKLGPASPAGLPEDQIREIERGVYSLNNSNSAYISQIKLVYLNLCPNSILKNCFLLNALKTGQISAYEVGRLKEADMDPDKWSVYNTKLAEAKQVSHGPQVVASDIIKCKCGGQTTFTEQQTRSCDEAMTIKATCLKCGKKFNI